MLPAWVAEMDFELAAAGPGRAASAAVELDDLGYVGTSTGCSTRSRASCDAPARLERRSGRVTLVTDVMVGIEELLRHVTAPGDGVIINPPCLSAVLPRTSRTRERRIVEVPLLADFCARLSTGSTRPSSAGARALLLCNPHNPTGRVSAARRADARWPPLADAHGACA